jgi:hypothetical protein
MHRCGWFGGVAAYFIRSVLVCVCGALLHSYVVNISKNMQTFNCFHNPCHRLMQST